MSRRKRTDVHDATCAACGKVFEETDYSMLANAIMRCKPACSFDCNVALGQAEPKKETPAP